MLSPKHQRFVAEYLIDLNATQAAIRAGYSAKTARSIASELLTKPDIQHAVSEGEAARLQRADLTAQRVLEEMRRVAFSDPRKLFDEHGNLKPIQSLSAEDAAVIGSFEVLIKNAKAGDGVTDTVHKFRMWDKPRVLESLAKHFGLLTEQVHHTGDITISWQSTS